MKIFNKKNYTVSIDLSKSYKCKTIGNKGKEIDDETGKCLLIAGKKSRGNLPKEIKEEKEIKKLLEKNEISLSDDVVPEKKSIKLKAGNNNG